MRQKTGAKLLSLAMSVILAVGLMPLPAFAVWPEEATGGGDATGENSATSTGEELGLQAVDTDLLTATPLDAQASTIDYVDAKGNAKKTNSAVKFTSSSALGESSAWYYVEGSVSKTDIWVSPDRPYNTINLILCDGAKLTTNGIEIAKGKTLRIWCQKGQTGKLQTNKYGIRVKSGGTVEINGGVIRADTWEDGQAGIGGKDSEGAGTITINSGDVKAWGADEAAGIGCGSHGAWNGTITINGGKVYAAADEDGGAGIGGGSGNNSGGGTITINGGEVEAIGSSSGAGIGSGYNQNDGANRTKITINGGTVKATGGDRAAGIGSGERGSELAATITITGGNVTATGGDRGAGIGGGDESGAGIIKVTGGTVTATGGETAAGIGSGDNSDNGYGGKSTITIEGGKVTAQGGERGAGIGGGEHSWSCGTINITGGEVQATGGERGAGIGGGDEGGGGEKGVGGINIGNGKAPVTVTAKGGKFAAGIGSGDNSDNKHSSTIKIIGKVTGKDDQGRPLSTTNVIATGGEDGAGIGGGDYSPSGDITIMGASVQALGSRRGAGIGGSCDAPANNIKIVGSCVMASADYAAGIGTGAASLNDDDPDKIYGGNIDISQSYVAAVSKLGGAGIGGGIFGCVNNITIKGGATVAQGGVTAGPGTIPYLYYAEKGTEGIVDGAGGFIDDATEAIPFINLYGDLLGVTFGWAADIISGVIGLFTDDPDMIFYTGAGIGGGHGAYGTFEGSIHISDDAIVQATAGMLPPDFVLKENVEKNDIDFVAPDRAHAANAIGSGGDKQTEYSAYLYKGCMVITANITLDATKNPKSETGTGYDYSPVTNDLTVTTVPRSSDWTGIDEAQRLVRTRNYAVIQPLPKTATISFSANGGEGEMQAQTGITMGSKTTLSPNTFTREGYWFAGWNTEADGSGQAYDDGAEVTANNMVLFAQWEQVHPVFRTHSLILDGSIGVNFFMELPEIEGVDYAKSYMEFNVSGKGATTATDAYDANDRSEDGSCYGFTCYVNSIQMADTITATFHYTEGTEEKTVSQTYSVAEYVKAFDERLSADPKAFDETTVNLIHALADYGHYAQPYLSAVHGWKVGTDYTEMPGQTKLTDEMTAEAREKCKSFAVNAELPDSGEVSSVSMSLDLLSNTTAYVYVNTTGSAGVKSAKLADGTALKVEKTGDGQARVAIPGIMAQDLSNISDITITTSGGTQARVRVAALSFAQAVLGAQGNGFKQGASDLATALWRYSDAADSYMKAHSES